MNLSRRLLFMQPAIRRARTAPRKLTSTIRALEPWKYPKSLHQGKNEKNGIAEAIPFSLAPRCFLIGRHLLLCPFLFLSVERQRFCDRVADQKRSASIGRRRSLIDNDKIVPLKISQQAGGRINCQRRSAHNRSEERRVGKECRARVAREQ